MRLRFPNGEHGDMEIGQGTTSLGSGSDNDVVLDAEGIAERHARVSREAEGIFIRPVDGADVYVNGRRIEDRTALKAGDVLGLHKVQVRIGASETRPGGDADSDPQEPPPDATRVRPAVVAWNLRGVSGDSFGRVVAIHGRMVVGRGDGCDVVLEASEVSRRHAVLDTGAGQVTVEDLGSSNGTFVNGERVRKRALKRGDEIAFDTVRFRVESAGSASAASRPAPPRRPPPAAVEKSGKGGYWIAAALIVAAAAGAAWYLGWLGG